LWKNTLEETVPVGAIPAQIDYALQRLCHSTDANVDSREWQNGLKPAKAPLRQIKLYNNGSFFDPRAIPSEDFKPIADRVAPFERIVVECHPSLVGESVLRFRDLLSGRLEVAMGLETVHPEVLPRLNKRMTLELFSRAAELLRQNEIALRVFILVKPPFLDESEAFHWAQRSIDFAFDDGAAVVSLIPTRFGNGALEALAERGEFSQPKLSTLEAALAYGIGLRRGRVFADLWDLEKFSGCDHCFAARLERLRKMNHAQAVPPSIRCLRCGVP